MNKKYKIIKNCFLGNEGEIVEVSGFYNESETWTNLNQNKSGSPVGPNWDDLEEIKVGVVSKKEFESYEKVRVGGQTNMFAINTVAQLSGLERDTIQKIMENYETLSYIYL